MTDYSSIKGFDDLPDDLKDRAASIIDTLNSSAPKDLHELDEPGHWSPLHSDCIVSLVCQDAPQLFAIEDGDLTEESQARMAAIKAALHMVFEDGEKVMEMGREQEDFEPAVGRWDEMAAAVLSVILTNEKVFGWLDRDERRILWDIIDKVMCAHGFLMVEEEGELLPAQPVETEGRQPVQSFNSVKMADYLTPEQMEHMFG